MNCDEIAIKSLKGLASLQKELAEQPGNTFEKYLRKMEEATRFHGTFDSIEDFSNRTNIPLADKLASYIAKEKMWGQGVKLAPEEEKLGNQILQQRVSPMDILEPENMAEGEHDPAIVEGLKNLSPDKRMFFARRTILRKEARGDIADAKRIYGNVMKQEDTYRNKDWIDAMDDWSARLVGEVPFGKESPWGETMPVLNSVLFKNIFSNNPKFAALQFADLGTMGVGEIGFRPLGAALKLTKDSTVRDYFFGGQEVRGYYRQNETAFPEPEFLKKLNATPAAQKLTTALDTQAHNEKIINLASFWHYGERNAERLGSGDQFVKDVVAGKAEPDDIVEAYVDAMKHNISVTGGGTFGINRDVVQRTPLLQVFANFSGQQLRIARMIRKWVADPVINRDTGAMKEGFGKTARLLGMTVALGGSAIIPKEIEPLLQKADGEYYYAMKEALDSMNVLSKAGIDITDKLKYSILNYGVNALAELGGKILEQGAGALNGKPEDWPKVIGNAIMLMPLHPLNVGMGTWKRLATDIAAATRGAKDVWAFTDQAIPVFNKYIAKGEMKFDTAGFLRDFFLPGITPEQYKWEAAQRKRSNLKEMGWHESGETYRQEQASFPNIRNLINTRKRREPSPPLLPQPTQ